MRSITSSQSAMLNQPFRELDYDVRVTTRAGREVSLRSYQGREFLRSVRVNEDVDTPAMECELSVQREFEGIGFSPFMFQSPVNRHNGAEDPLLALDNVVRVIVGFPNLDDPAQSLVIFYGRITSVDAAGVKVVARDSVYDLTQAFIDPAFGAAGGAARPTGIEMAGPVENIMSYLIESFAPNVAFIHTPVPAGWQIEPYLQDRMSVWEALERFAMQIGWDLRWRWTPGSRTNGALTFFEPGRSGTGGGQHTFGPEDYFSFDSLELNLDSVRTRVYVTFGPGNARYTVVSVHSGSEADLRFPRVMWIEESSTSPLQSINEASRMAQSALADVGRPKATASVKMPLFPWSELHDSYLFPANGVHFDAALSFSVSSITHELSAGKATTTLGVRDGAAASGSRRWLRREFRQGVKYL